MRNNNSDVKLLNYCQLPILSSLLQDAQSLFFFWEDIPSWINTLQIHPALRPSSRSRAAPALLSWPPLPHAGWHANGRRRTFASEELKAK